MFARRPGTACPIGYTARMKDDRSSSALPPPERDGGDDDDAVMAADDTGMLAGERLITQAELIEGNSGAADDASQSGRPAAAGDV